jgi:hypothetical protein
VGIEPNITFLKPPRKPDNTNLVEGLGKSKFIVSLSLKVLSLECSFSEYDGKFTRTLNEVVMEPFLEKGVAVLFFHSNLLTRHRSYITLWMF